MSSTSAALDAIERILEAGGDADDILRHVVAALHDDAGYTWAGIFFVEEGKLVARPARRHARRDAAHARPRDVAGRPHRRARSR